MTIRVQLTSPDVDRQIHILREFPEIAEKHYRPALLQDVYLLENTIRGGIPIRSGAAYAGFGSKVTGKGLRLRAEVGWYDKNDPWYINVVEHGAKPHQIRSSKKGGFLWFGGTYAKVVNHPGFSARGFMAAGYSMVQPIIENDLARASERILTELEIK